MQINMKRSKFIDRNFRELKNYYPNDAKELLGQLYDQLIPPDPEKCKGFTEVDDDGEPYDVNCMCVNCKRFTPECETRLVNFIGWAGENEHCDKFKRK